MYFIILNGTQYSIHFCQEEALIDAAHLDFIYNSPELNDGIQGHNEVQMLSFAEMMESSVEMVI